MTTARPFDGPAAAAFLREHWQKKPAYLAAAIGDVPQGIDWQALAADAAIESRLVRQRGDRFEVLDGPFATADLDALSEPWTVLVQDADHYLPSLRRLLDAFAFLPRWRFEDVMLSFAVDGGSVGPHVDQYDVFLLQADGERHWQVGDAGASVLREDGDGLRLVEPFPAALEVTAKAGDLLYLPPGVPHHGVARGPCVTYSIGFRAPTAAELAAVVLEESAMAQRYADPDLQPCTAVGRVDADSVARAQALLRGALDLGPTRVANALGRLMTEPKDWLWPVPPDQTLTAVQVREQLSEPASELVCATGTRVALSEPPAAPALFINGEVVALGTGSGTLAEQLATRRRAAGTLVSPGPDDHATLAALTDLINEGALFIATDN